MFENLTSSFERIFSGIRGRGKLSQTDIDNTLGEIRTALLEADVNLDVVTSLLARIRSRALGQELSGALNPAQQVVKIVLAELTVSLGNEATKLRYSQKPPTVVLLAGLQGTGKTTCAAKLALWYKKQGRKPMLVGADLQRPAAVEQLRKLAETISVPVYSESAKPARLARRAIKEATRSASDVVIVDTAGRLAIDKQLMAEIAAISNAIDPDYTFLVVDAMVGQDALPTAKSFSESLDLDGVILTKLDGDARGGAALSVREVVGKPIVFASVGERIEDLEAFHPERLASRILGMGDVETLIEKAEEAFEAEQAQKATEKMLDGTFTLDDFLAQMRQIKKMGPLGNLLSMMPGIPKEARNVEIDDHHIARIEGIIHSMTPNERVEPNIINGSRRLRIANGSGVPVSEVKRLTDQFGQMRQMMKKFGGPASAKSGLSANRNRSRKQRGGSSRGGGSRGGSSRGGGSRGGGSRKQGKQQHSGRVTEKAMPSAAKPILSLPGLEDRVVKR